MPRQGIRASQWGPRKKGYKTYRSYRNKYKQAKRQRSIAAEVRRVLNGSTGGYVGLEKKFFDTGRSIALTAPTDASGGEVDNSTNLCLNCPAQGDGESQRDGRQISMHSINIKGTITIASQADQSAGDTVPDIFIALVMDKQTNAAQLDSEDVFENPTGITSLATSPFRNLEYTSRFTVLATRKISAVDLAGAIQPVFDGTNIEQQGAQIPFSIYKTLGGKKVNFISGQTTSTVAAIADNSLHLIAYSTNTSMVPTINYNSRLRFVG